MTYYIVAWESGTDPYTPGETSIQLLVSRFQSPVVMTLPASNITSTSMILRGLANPSGAATAAWFEWGTTTNYGNSTGGQSLGGGSSNLLITAPLSGLSATNYHFHLKATNSVGFSIGLDRTAIWSAAPPWFSSISSVGNGSWQLRFTGVTAQLYLLQASSNLADWAQIGTALDLGNGLFQYQDSSASSLPARFYRVLAL